MRPWVADFTFQLARALRVVGVAIVVVAWASVLASEAQQSAEIRSLVQVGASVGAVLVAQWFTGLPPSAASGLRALAGGAESHQT